MSWFPWRSRTVVYGYRKAKRDGRRDGRDWEWTFWPFKKDKPPLPRPDQATAPFEREVKELADGVVQSLETEWRDLDRDLLSAYLSAQTEYREADTRCRAESDEAGEAQKAFAAARKALSKMELPGLSRRWMLTWLALIALGEFFFNAMVFQVFGQAPWETWLMALPIGIGIPLAGHFVGQGLKESEKTRGKMFLMGATPVVLFAVLYGLAALRAQFAEGAGTTIERIIGFHLTVEQLTWMFLLFNVFLFFASILITFAGTHPEPRLYRTRWKTYRRAHKELGTESEEAREAAKVRENAEKKLRSARVAREACYQRYRSMLEEVKESADWVCHVYRIANQRARSDGVTPACFSSDPPTKSLALPKVFASETLNDWDREEGWQPAGAAVAPASAVGQPAAG